MALRKSQGETVTRGGMARCVYMCTCMCVRVSACVCEEMSMCVYDCVCMSVCVSKCV